VPTTTSFAMDASALSEMQQTGLSILLTLAPAFTTVAFELRGFRHQAATLAD